MKALLLLLIAACAALPMRWAVAGLPAVWIFQRLLPPGLAAVAQVGGTEVSPADLLIVLLAARTAVALLFTKEIVVDPTLYLALAAYVVVMLIASLAAGIKFGEAHLARCVVSWARFV